MIGTEQRWLARWYGVARPGIGWRVLSQVYRGLRALTLAPYWLGWRRAARTPVPVVVVGNLTVGGSGKTPLVMALTERLRDRGLAVGVISRGYGRANSAVRLVDAYSTAADVGDEPLMMAQRLGVPVAVGADRCAALRRLTDAVPLDLVLSDDGLDHLKLCRALEIVVIDGERGFGNGYLLPAGPLRAPIGRLAKADAVVRNGGTAGPGELSMHVAISGFDERASGQRLPADAFRGQRAHVIAGVGNPKRIFDACRAVGIEVIEHPLPDHASAAQLNDLRFGDDLPRIYTEKDAVKLRPSAGQWVCRTQIFIDERLVDMVAGCVDSSGPSSL
jgi:tetraacyldisaccharide 4'-kinase